MRTKSTDNIRDIKRVGGVDFVALLGLSKQNRKPLSSLTIFGVATMFQALRLPLT